MWGWWGGGHGDRIAYGEEVVIAGFGELGNREETVVGRRKREKCAGGQLGAV